MAMKRVFTGICAFLACIFTAAAIAAVIFCQGKLPVLVQPSQDAVRQAENFMEAVCRGNFVQAQTMLHGQPDLGADRMPSGTVGQMVWNAYVESLDYELVGPLCVTENGLVQNVKIISLELSTATEEVGERARGLLNGAIESAEDVSELYDGRNNYREDLVTELLDQAAREALEEDVRYGYQVIPLQLVFEDGCWQVVADQKLLDAISGGLTRTGAMIDKFDAYMANVTGDALEGILSVEKSYWLHDADLIAPGPDPENYGETADSRDLETVIQKAEKLLEGQELIFRTDTQIMEGSTITYYYDETILCVTWQETDGNSVYTCSEVKIAHPSQFRRFLSDGKFGSGKLYKATQMAAVVNAVTASNGDYYAFRGYGNLVYNGEVKMAENRYLDTCYVDENGDLIMLDMGSLYKMEDVRRFVEENRIRFSLAFGPILVRDGKMVAKHYYALGETESYYSRSALCQIDSLHYMFVTVNRGGKDVSQFAAYLKKMGVRDAYALDGGQTSTIVTGNRLMNPVDYGGERETSDIIYFATALPDGG